MDTKKELISKKLNLISLIIALTIPPVFVIYSFFSENADPKYLYFLKNGTFIAPFLIIYFFVFNSLYKKNSKVANAILFLVNFFYILLILNITGGTDSPLIFSFYFLILISFVFSIYFGIGALVLSLLYLGFDLIINNKLDSNYTHEYSYVISLFFVSISAYFFGKQYRRNIAERKKMVSLVETLSSNKNQEEAIFSSIIDGVYAVDNERNLVLFNKAAAEMTGWGSKEAIGMKCSTVMKLRNDQSMDICQKDCPMLNVWNTGENFIRDDLCFFDKAKKTVQISGSYSAIKDINGKITGGICVFRDVTKSKELERLRNEFVSTASHELRTPITTLEGYIDLASNEKVSKIDEKAKEYLSKAHDAVIGMATLVKNLLSVTKLEEGRLESNNEKFEINELLELVIEELTALAQKKNLYIHFDKSKTAKTGKVLAPSIKVNCDRTQIKEVLTNLIENGIKFTKEGGVTVSLDQDKDFAIISIQDTGMGIPKDAIKHLFQKFYRVDNSATREVGGTGLGLYITRSIIEYFGGQIWVESTEGKGAKFVFTVPKTLD